MLLYFRVMLPLSLLNEHIESFSHLYSSCVAAKNYVLVVHDVVLPVSDPQRGQFLQFLFIHVRSHVILDSPRVLFLPVNSLGGM